MNLQYDNAATYYELFEIPMDASIDIIDSAYNKLLQRYKGAYNNFQNIKLKMESEYPIEFLSGDLLNKIKTVDNKIDYKNTIDPNYILGVSKNASVSEIKSNYTTYTNEGPNIYQLLDVPITESIEEISNKYNRIVSKYKNISNNMISVETKLNNLQKIYEILINPETRKSYDDELRAKNVYFVGYHIDLLYLVKSNLTIIMLIIITIILVYLLVLYYKKHRKQYSKNNMKSRH